jgi:hypothetical protein
MTTVKFRNLSISLTENDYGNEAALRFSDGGNSYAAYFTRRDNHEDAAKKLEYLAKELRQRHIALMQELVDEQDDILGTESA